MPSSATETDASPSEHRAFEHRALLSNVHFERVSVIMRFTALYCASCFKERLFDVPIIPIFLSRLGYGRFIDGARRTRFPNRFSSGKTYFPKLKKRIFGPNKKKKTQPRHGLSSPESESA